MVLLDNINYSAQKASFNTVLNVYIFLIDVKAQAL